MGIFALTVPDSTFGSLSVAALGYAAAYRSTVLVGIQSLMTSTATIRNAAEVLERYPGTKIK